MNFPRLEAKVRPAPHRGSIQLKLPAGVWAAGTAFEAVLAAHMIADLDAGRFERFAHRNINVLGVFAVDRHLDARQHEVEPYRELSPSLSTPMQRLNSHMAGPDALALPPQLARLFVYISLERGADRNAAQADLYRYAHDSRH